MWSFSSSVCYSNFILRSGLLLAYGASTLVTTPGVSAQTAANDPRAPNPFESIVASETLHWVPCPPVAKKASNLTLEANVTNGISALSELNNRECARLLVPFDYDQKNKTGGHFSIALARIPAPSKHNYRGPLFFNPGGPGYSGVESLGSQIKSLRDIAGDDFDLVSWDPRAVGSTLPPVSCFADATSPLLDSSLRYLGQANDTLVRNDAINQFVASSCFIHSGHLLPYLGTVTAAQDLMRMVEAYGYSNKLSYFGASYGTVLGATFARLYPNNLKRMILDGNLSPTAWYNQVFSPEAYEDADQALDEFFQLCFLAGPDRCAFWYSSPTLIREAFLDIDNRIHLSPVPTRDGIFDWTDFREFVIQSIRSPKSFFAGGLDVGLAAAIRNGSFEKLSNLSRPVPLNEWKPLVDPDSGYTNEQPPLNLWLIKCLDHPSLTVQNATELESLLASLQLEKRGLLPQGPAVLESMFCTRYNVTPSERLNGTFTNIATNVPIIFLNNIYDARTSLEQAVRASAGYKNSVVLVNNATGHIALTDMNKCLKEKLSQYMANLTLPTNGTICQPDILPFNLYPNGTLAPESQLADNTTTTSNEVSASRRLIKRSMKLY